MKVIATATNIGQAFKNAARVREIVTILVRHGFADFLHRMKLSRFLPSRTADDPRFQHLPFPERLRMSFEELGPTFVKLGQLLATRPDLLPEVFIDEFEKLQDKVGAVAYNEIKPFIESELKSRLEDLFSEFETEPMAAASIAQVHRASLKTNEKVAVKVQRPGIERMVHNDVSILRGLAVLLEKYIPETRPFNPVGLVEEFFKTILFEIDFVVEANNIRKIQNNLATFKRVAIPKIVGQLSTSRLLVLERLDGIRFSDREAIISKGFKPSDIVALGSDVFFHMVMHDGLFHGDLHPGNLFVLPEGRLGIIDFGIVGRLSRRTQDGIIVMFTALVEEDYETLTFEYLNVCHPKGQTDITLLQKDLMDLISPYVGLSLGEINVGKILLRTTAIAAKHHLQVPRELMLLFKAMVTIEAMGKKLDPSFDLMQSGTHLAKQVITNRYSKQRLFRDLLVVGRDLQGLLESAPRQARHFLRVWTQNNFAIEVQNKDLSRLVRATHQLTQGHSINTFCAGFFAVGITFLILDRGPYIVGMPVSAMITLGIASGLLARRAWSLRRDSR